MSPSDCLFCKIVEGDVPADVIAESDHALAFRDIAPKAPVHVLVIPKLHVASLGDADAAHAEILGDLMLLARDVAVAEGVAETGYRTILNTGDDGGQSVHHLHAHVLGGRSLGWPPG